MTVSPSHPAHATAAHVLGIDFGTSNSAMAWRSGQGLSQPLAVEGAATAMPTALFFNAEDHKTHFGRDAVTHYLAGTEGRLMRSLKSLLGSPLLLEKTEVNGQAVSFQDIIATYLAELKARAVAHTGTEPTRVVLGRPVHFVDDDPERDALAQRMLLDAAHTAGLRNVGFQLEPIAAAFDHERRITRESVVLVADIGGGTSDFTVVRLGPERVAAAARTGSDRSEDILATRGVHIGGTDCDQRLGLGHTMPLLGFRHTGPDGREVPSAVFFDLATWHLIHWRYSAKAIREAQALRPNYTDQALHQRLIAVLQERLAHAMANSVEQAKIASSQSGTSVDIDLACLARDLSVPLAPDTLQQDLAPLLQRVVACALACTQAAGLTPGQLDAIYLTGGSSALRPFQAAMAQAFAGVPLLEGDLFGGVAAGLVYSA
jgi:hypothetical chaperone protein